MQTRHEEVLKTSWKTKKCYAEDIFKTSKRRLGKQEMFAGFDESFLFHVKTGRHYSLLKLIGTLWAFPTAMFMMRYLKEVC